MSKVNANVEFNSKKVADIKRKLLKPVQIALDIQIVKDSNYYCPEMDGTLKKSATRSNYGSGILEWDTPYARNQYYSKPNKSHDKNPNARMEWFEEAKGTKLKEWVRLVNDKYNK